MTRNIMFGQEIECQIVFENLYGQHRPGGDVVDALSGSVDRSALVVISCSHAPTSTSAAAASASVGRPPNPPLEEPNPEPERFDLSLDWFGEMLLDLVPVTRVGLLIMSEPCVLPMLPAQAPKE